jgi:peptide deformylase
MAIREIRMLGESVLRKKAKEVTEMTPKIRELIVDMFETMNQEAGVGLAAPQVGILKRIVVMNVDGENDLILINPVILEASGEQVGKEGCLSLPGKHGTVARPNYVKVKALDENMKEFILEGTELLARAICHECDHLDGIFYTSHVIGELEDVTDDIEEE